MNGREGTRRFPEPARLPESCWSDCCGRSPGGWDVIDERLACTRKSRSSSGGKGFFHFNPTPYNAGLADWELPEDMHPSPSPLNLYDLPKKDKTVHAAMFFGDLPTQKAANWNKTLEWIESLDFICLADIYHSSVADYVDLILPACSKFESVDEIGGMRCFNGYVMSNQKVLDPLFEAKTDFYIEKGIAEAMGLGQYFPKDSVEYAKAQLANPIPPIEGITRSRPYSGVKDGK